jgi:hypothetical protein
MKNYKKEIESFDKHGNKLTINKYTKIELYLYKPNQITRI